MQIIKLNEKVFSLFCLKNDYEGTGTGIIWFLAFLV